jgi:hypothetical protein
MDEGTPVPIRTPFWIITDRSTGVCTPVVPACAPGHIAVFTDEAKARAYMAGVDESLWEAEIVTSRTARMVFEMHRLLSVKGYCIDPTRDGCAGTVSIFSVSLHD